MELIIKIDDKDYELINKTGITLDLNTAFHGKGKDKEMTFAIFNLVKALKNGTPYNPTGDCISREALKEEVRKHTEYYADRTSEDRYNVGYTECACEILDFIDIAPVKFSLLPADESKEEAYMRGYEHGKVEGLLKAYTRPKGEWIKEPNGKTTDIYRCSICGRSILLCKNADLSKYPFCHCGADMKGGAE